MNCQRCEGNLQGELVYCPPCLSEVKAIRLGKVPASGSSKQPGSQAHDISSNFTTAQRIIIGGGLCTLVFSCLTFAFLQKPNLCKNMLEAFLLASCITSLACVTLIAVTLWLRVTSQNFLWGLICLLIPGLMITHLKVRWDEVVRQIKVLAVSYALFIVSLLGYKQTHDRNIEGVVYHSFILAISPYYAIKDIRRKIDTSFVSKNTILSSHERHTANERFAEY